MLIDKAMQRHVETKRTRVLVEILEEGKEIRAVVGRRVGKARVNAKRFTGDIAMLQKAELGGVGHISHLDALGKYGNCFVANVFLPPEFSVEESFSFPSSVFRRSSYASYLVCYSSSAHII